MLEQDLLRAIAAGPEEDAPRLVYADWLLESGDPRGELIQVQCALDGAGISPARRQRLRLRERELVRDVGAGCVAWAGGLVTAWQLRRGFVDGVTLRAEDFTRSGASLWRAAPLPPRRLTLQIPAASRARLDELLDAVAASPLLGGLEALTLAPEPEEEALDLDDGMAPPDGDGPPEPLGPSVARLLASPHLRRLVELDLAGCALGDDGAAAVAERFPSLASLRRLDLSDNRITVDGAIALGHSPHLQLTALALRHNELGARGARALAGGPSLRSLEALDVGADASRLQTNEIGDEGASALSLSPHLQQLRRLDVSHALVGAEGTKALLQNQALRSLEALELGHNDAFDGDRGWIAGAPLARLVELGLARTHLGDEGARHLAAALHLPSSTMRRIDLSYDEISLAGARALAAAPGLRGLEALLLRGDRLGDEGTAALAASLHVGPSLVRLDLAQNLLGTRAAAALAGWAALTQLVWLDLQDNRITDAGVWALTAAPQLVRVDHLVLAQNRLTADSGLAVGEHRRRARQSTDEEGPS